MVLVFYQLLSILISPFLIVHFLIRLCQKKENLYGIFERIGFQFGFFGKYVHIHAASVGEVKSSIKMISDIVKTGINVKITVMTLTAKKAMHEIFSDNKMVKISQSPFDSILFVIPFFCFNWPSKIIIIESDVWVNFVTFAKFFCKKLYYVNARMSENGIKKWIFVKKKLGLNLFEKFDKIYTSSVESKNRFLQLNDNSFFLGNLKNDYTPFFTKESKQFMDILSKCHGKKRLTLANTHFMEEDVLLNDFEKFDNILGIIAPRKISRINEIKKNLQSRLLKFVTFSEIISCGVFDQNNFDIILIDKMGVMPSVYEASDVVFVGGSLIDESIGGHNPLEAIFHKKPVIMGKFVKNWLEDVMILIENEILLQIDDRLDFTSAFNKFICDDKIKDKIDKFIEKKECISSKILNDMH